MTIKLKTLHTWIGIVSGLFLSVVALTLSQILFRSEFERAALPPQAGGAQRAGIDQAAAAIAQLRPGAIVRRVRIPGAVLRALGRAGDLVKRVRPFDFPLTAEAMDFASQWPGAVTSPEGTRLGVGFRQSHETFGDAIRWMVAAGHLDAKLAGRLGESPATTPRRG